MQIIIAMLIIVLVMALYFGLSTKHKNEIFIITKDIDLKKEKLKFEKNKLNEKYKQLEKYSLTLKENEVALDKKVELIEERHSKFEEELHVKNKELLLKTTDLETIKIELSKKEEILKQLYANKLEDVANLSKDDAKKELFSIIEEENKKYIDRELKESVEDLKLHKKETAREILISALESVAVDITNEIVVKPIIIPSEDVKGKLIGKEGRNIKAIENNLGVNLIIDDTPGIISISCFNSTRRAIAQIAIEELVKTGRINQVTIEEVTSKSIQKVHDIAFEKGRETVLKFNISDMDTDLVIKIGEMYFRSSYGQNLLQHSIEAAEIAVKLASEFSLKPHLAARCLLLHDIGKLDSVELGKSHVELGYKMAKKYGESEIVLNSILSHHGDEEPTSLYSILTIVADSASAGRTGSRRDQFEVFIERIEKLEKLALQNPGVSKAYALQGGRELRVLVESSIINDSALEKLARQIKRDIVNEVSFPGVIKVNIIRELRHTIEVSKDNKGD